MFAATLLGTSSYELEEPGVLAGPTAQLPNVQRELESNGPSLAAPLDPRTPLPPEAHAWVEQTLSRMSLSERAGQVLMVRAYGEYYAADAQERLELVRTIQELHLGGVILFRSQAYEATALIGDLQQAAAQISSVPLLMAADFEWGADFRIDGAIPFPTAMAVGATYNAEAAEWMGRATAADARALGIHWIFAPVADVNINPQNPVINVRAFGEDPVHVGRMVDAFVRGAQREGVLATAKHFPGHGDTAVDSHISLPVLAHNRERLQAVELAPFRAAIDAGVGSIMTAHLAVPALTADSRLPATLSPAILTDLLRTELGFEGLVVTDAMEMGGITRRWWGGQAAVESLVAGADMVLLPPNTRAAHGAVVAAVERGDLPAERLEDAVRQVLEAKARLGLAAGDRGRSLTSLSSRFALALEAEEAQQVADSAVTLLRDRSNLLPLDARQPRRIAVVGVSDNNTSAPTVDLVAALREPLGDVSSYSIDGRTRGDDAAEIVTAVARADVLILAVRVRLRTSSGTITLPSRQQRYAHMLAQLDVPTIVVALGSPYSAAAFPRASTLLAAYGWSGAMQRAAAHAIVGETPIGGKLPVSIPELYEVGFGLGRPALDARLQVATTVAGDETSPEAEIVPDLAEAQAILERWVAEGAFPGAVYAVGHKNQLVGRGAVGRMTYDDNAASMQVDSIFDLASLTKVIATTTVAMQAVERGHLRLDYSARALVPEFAGENKDKVTIRQLLTHTSGLPAYVEFYRDYEPGATGPDTRADVLERIYAVPLEAPPGSRYVYSDLGVILLGEVLTRALGEPFWEYAEREVFAPLGMAETGWLPDPALLDRIPPTERDPWRDRVVHGEVHDENTVALGGISSHAGLFSTVDDLSVFAQMLLNRGSYGHVRLARSGTVGSWVRRQEVVADSSRALGWDTAYGSESWGMFSPTAFGHTGFTGTSLWVDSRRQLFVVLLTNRVHPTRDNRKIRQARIDFHRAVVAAVDAASR